MPTRELESYMCALRMAQLAHTQHDKKLKALAWKSCQLASCPRRCLQAPFCHWIKLACKYCRQVASSSARISFAPGMSARTNVRGQVQWVCKRAPALCRSDVDAMAGMEQFGRCVQRLRRWKLSRSSSPACLSSAPPRSSAFLQSE